MTPVVSWYISGTWRVTFTEEADFLTLIILQKIGDAGRIWQMRKELMCLQRFMSSAWSRLNICTKTLSTYSQNTQEGIFLTNGLYDLTSVVLSLFGESVCGAIFSFYTSWCQDSCCFVPRVLGLCLTVSAFSVRQSALPTCVWDVPADDAHFSRRAPDTALRLLWSHHQASDGLAIPTKGSTILLS